MELRLLEELLELLLAGALYLDPDELLDEEPELDFGVEMVLVSDEEDDDFAGGDDLLDEELFFTGAVRVLLVLEPEVDLLLIGFVSSRVGGINVV